eukprot:m.168355 g.168355  ORF g.168355 m.168355 type:complete len:50 (+) comp14473_c0_seq6:89-238(+)
MYINHDQWADRFKQATPINAKISKVVTLSLCTLERQTFCASRYLEACDF